MTLVLLSNLIDEDSDIKENFPPNIKNIIENLDGLIAESEKSARRYLLKFISREEMQKIDILLLNEHSKEKDIQFIIKAIKDKNFGLISDAGLPCIADPGSKLVYLARENNIEIKATVGPSSIFLALMLSGLDSQKFYFHGYLPKEENFLVSKIQDLEKQSKEENLVQIFIEAPYRSDKILVISFRELIFSILSRILPRFSNFIYNIYYGY